LTVKTGPVVVILVQEEGPEFIFRDSGDVVWGEYRLEAGKDAVS